MNKKNKNTFKCSICGKICQGYGNNPWPVSKNANDRCCDSCNDTKVIPMRIASTFRR